MFLSISLLPPPPSRILAILIMADNLKGKCSFVAKVYLVPKMFGGKGLRTNQNKLKILMFCYAVLWKLDVC